MSATKMQLVTVSGDNEELHDTVKRLYNCGYFQPENAGKHISSSLGFIPYADHNPYTVQLEKMLGLLQNSGHTVTYSPDVAQMPLTEEEKEHLNELYGKAEKISERKKTLLAQKNDCEEGITKFSHFTELPVELDDITDLEFVKVRFGHMPRESAKKLPDLFKKCPYFYFVPCSADKTDYWGVYFSPKNHIDEVDGFFAMLLFEPFEVPSAVGTAENVVTELRSNLKIIDDELLALEKESAEIWNDETEFCDAVYSKVYTLDRLEQLKAYSVHNGHYFMLVGWIPCEELDKFSELIKNDKVSFELSDTDPEISPPPVKAKKHKGLLKFLVDPYEFYINMYGTPSYKDIDVTPFVAITYTILFGVMFGDMGHGLVLSIVGCLMYKFKKLELGRILIPCGISSMVFGFIFGSVFGFEELLDPVYHALGMNGKPLAVMESVNTVLLVTLVIGIALTTLSMLLNVYGCIKNKRYGEAIFSNNGLTGIAVYLCGANLASSFMGAFSPIPNKAAFVIIGVGMVLLLIKEILIGAIDKHKDFMPESMGDFLLQNVFELIEYVLSYLSNTLSFLRIGAYVLVHAGMMLAVFALAGENANPVIIVIGNIFVIAIEGLLTGIQVLRLEFYEMFSRFYGGDGKPFIPFTDKQFSIGGNKNEKH